MKRRRRGSALEQEEKVDLPLLVYDGDFDFCRRWIARWRAITGERVEYAPYQEVAGRFPQIPIEDFKRSVQLILPGGEIFAGAHAVFRTLALAPRRGWMAWMYEHVPGTPAVSESVYGMVAKRRRLFSGLTRLFLGDISELPSYVLTRWMFLRFLGLIYLVAFVSLSTQITGLVGSHGILPAADYLRAVRENFGQERYWLFPTLAWVDASDGFLLGLTVAGALLSILLVLGVASVPVLVLLWALYLSLGTVGQDFMMFQWDSLLSEIGFLAIFFAPLQLKPDLERERQPSPVVLWLLRLLLFRLMFSSGLSKLLSGDPTWRHFTALNYHYETQPLPTPFGWVLHQLPPEYQKVSVAVMFFVELVVPFLIFARRRLRFLAAAAMIVLQLLIAATGNYTFFNLLAIALCLLLFDDAEVSRLFPRRFRGQSQEAGGRLPEWRPRAVAAAALALVLIPGNLAELPGLRFERVLWRSARQTLNGLRALRIVNQYGLFSVMTTTRPEIVIEGSSDGNTWLAYEFNYKPGDVFRPLRWVAPHQPRLDWQMWFAALGGYQANPWFANLMLRLLQGSPEVLGLLARNPFPNAPPRYVRAMVYNYHFTDFETQRATGAWWRRELKGLYFPIVGLP